MATVYQIDEANIDLAKLIARAKSGDDIVLADRAGSQVRLVPVPRTLNPKRVPGTLKGKVWLDDRFFEPLPEDELRRWEGRDD